MEGRAMFLLVCRTFLSLFSLELSLLTRDFAAIYRRVRKSSVSTMRLRRYSEQQILRAIDLACAFYFKEVLCLQRSVVTTRLLRRYGVDAGMGIGVRRTPFQAHAWVEVAGRCVSDRPYIPQTYLELDRC